MTDREKNRFSARAARYARVGANVGGVAARIRGEPAARLGARPRPRTRRTLAAALGGLKGPIMKVAQLMATIPDALPPEYAEELAEAAKRGAADGLGLRQAAHDGRARRRTGRRNSPSSSTSRPPPPRSARCIARARMTASALACKLQYPDMQSAVEADLQQLDWLFAIHRRMDPAIDTTRDRQGDRARACARSSTIGARRSTSRFIARCSRASIIVRVPAVWPELSTGRLLTLDWLDGTQAARRTRTRRSPARNRIGHGDVHRLVVSVQPLRRDPRRSASRQLHGVRREAARRAASTCSTMAASASSRRNSSAAWSISTTACCTATTICVVHAYETWGFKGLSRETDRHAQHLGPVHLRAAARRPRAHHRRRREAVANTGAARRSACIRR